MTTQTFECLVIMTTPFEFSGLFHVSLEILEGKEIRGRCHVPPPMELDYCDKRTQHTNRIYTSPPCCFNNQLPEIHCTLKYIMYDTMKCTLQTLQKAWVNVSNDPLTKRKKEMTFEMMKQSWLSCLHVWIYTLIKFSMTVVHNFMLYWWMLYFIAKSSSRILFQKLKMIDWKWNNLRNNRWSNFYHAQCLLTSNKRLALMKNNQNNN